MSEIFLEVVIVVPDAIAVGIASRGEIEDPLEEALVDSGLGEVTGGGSGMGKYVVDVEVSEQGFGEALRIIRKVLVGLRVPVSSRIKRNKPLKIEYIVYDATGTRPAN